jgi:D-glycero-D-manno-heptose 1,7-bisphosphate phosphatase
MNKAVFLDRDGVINNDTGHYYISSPADFRLNKGIEELLAWLRKEGFLLIIISNQGGISRGIFTLNDAEKVNRYMNELLGKKGISLDEVYYCPHHPENGNCLCRKPDTIQIEKALARFSADPSRSFFIGDRETDMEAGKKAGLKTVLVETNQDMSKVIEVIKAML